jgi:glycosyltransferase involved in cell wall biosynthesis
MKMMFLARALGPGGAERQMALLASGLQCRGHDVTVASFYPGGIFRQNVINAGVRHICLEKRGRWDVIGFAFRLRRLLKNQRPHVLYSFLPPANILAAVLGRYHGGPRIVWGYRVSEMDLSHYGWLERLSYAIERWLSPLPDLLIFNSESGLLAAGGRGLKSKSIVIPNGIDIHAFAPSYEARHRLREAWGVREGELVIGLVGRFDPMKDHATFLHAVDLLSKRRPNGLRIVLVGMGLEANNVRLHDMLEETNLTGKALLLGERSDIPAIMAALDILCLPSAFGEGFPNVIGEAMAAGTPCVATDVGDTHKIIGDTGIVVPPRDVEALSQAIDKLLSRLSQAPGETRKRARDRIVANFSLEQIIDQNEQILIELLGNRPVIAATDRV